MEFSNDYAKLEKAWFTATTTKRKKFGGIF